MRARAIVIDVGFGGGVFGRGRVGELAGLGALGVVSVERCSARGPALRRSGVRNYARNVVQADVEEEATREGGVRPVLVCLGVGREDGECGAEKGGCGVVDEGEGKWD